MHENTMSSSEGGSDAGRPVGSPGEDRIMPRDSATGGTAEREYAERLNRLQGKKWKKILNVQAPWKAHIRHLQLGRTLDVGCGNGRNLSYLRSDSVGVDHNEHSVQTARAIGGEAYTVDEFFASPDLVKPAGFDSLLAAHLIEHLHVDEARTIIGSYLPMIKRGGRVVFFTPQERGYESDPTHVAFTDFEALRRLSDDLGLVTLKDYSFPFPRRSGKLFIYNEFIHIAQTPRS